MHVCAVMIKIIVESIRAQYFIQPIDLKHLIFACRYATEVDVDFVRKSVRAIGRCAIKVEVSCAVANCFDIRPQLFKEWVTLPSG